MGIEDCWRSGLHGNDGWMRVRSPVCGAASPTIEPPGRRGRAPIRRDDDRAPSRGRARWLPVSDQDSRASGFEGLRVGTAHDVSIRMAIAADGRCLGIVPAANVSMMCMRPPQQGQGLGSVRSSSVVAAAIGSASGGGVRTLHLDAEVANGASILVWLRRSPVSRPPRDQITPLPEMSTGLRQPGMNERGG